MGTCGIGGGWKAFEEIVGFTGEQQFYAQQQGCLYCQFPSFSQQFWARWRDVSRPGSIVLHQRCRMLQHARECGGVDVYGVGLPGWSIYRRGVYHQRWCVDFARGGMHCGCESDSVLRVCGCGAGCFVCGIQDGGGAHEKIQAVDKPRVLIWGEDFEAVFAASFFVFDVDPQHFGFVVFGQIAQKKFTNFGPFNQVFAGVFV